MSRTGKYLNNTKIKRIIMLVIAVLMMLSALLPMITYAEEQTKVEIILYGTDSCSNCKIIKEFLAERNYKVTVDYRNADEVETFEEFQRVAKYLGNQTLSPFAIVGDKALAGEKEITGNFDRVLEEEINSDGGYKLLDVDNIDLDNKEITEETFKSMNLTVIALAGLVDGVNPCALAMLILLISTVIKLDKKKVIYVGVSFALGTFITYYFIGFNLFKMMEVAVKLSWLTIVIYTITILICLYIIYLNTKDYLAIKKGDIGGIQNQLNKNQKKLINKFISKMTTSTNIIIYGFILGVILTIMEFTCTGQVYLPTVSYIISSGEGGILPYVYIGIYNLMFIVPLIIVCVIAYIGKSTKKLSNLLYEKIGYIKLITNIIYLIIVVSMVIRLLRIM